MSSSVNDMWMMVLAQIVTFVSTFVSSNIWYNYNFDYFVATEF